MSTYLRLPIAVHDGWRAVVGAAAGKLTKSCRRDLNYREARKAFYREMLASHEQAQEVVRYFRL